MKKTFIGLILCWNLTLHAQALDPEKLFATDVNNMNSIPQLLELASETLKNEQHARQEVVLKKLIELRPFNPDFRFALIKSYALQDKKSEAYNDLIELQKAGLSYPIGDQVGFDNIKDTKVFTYIEDGMNKNAEPFGEGSKAFEVSSNYSGMLFENLAYDQAADRFLLGSVRAGSIYQYTQDGGFKEFIAAGDPAIGPWGIIDLVIDQKADLLWTSSATLPHYSGTNQANFGQAMISKFQLSTGKLLNNFAMPKSQQPMLFTALHVSAAQNLYFINAFSSGVYKISNNSDQVQPLLALPSMSSIKAITSNNKESVLYVSDFEQGIFLVNLESMQVAPLVKSDKGFIAGVSDLFYDEGDLVAIQSGVSPSRLMRYVLKNDLFLLNLFPIEASNPNFASLGNGVLVDGSIYYAANSQWAKVDGLGRLATGLSWDPLMIMKSPTKYRMEEHMEQQKNMEDIKRRRGIKK